MKFQHQFHFQKYGLLKLLLDVNIAYQTNIRISRQINKELMFVIHVENKL